MRFWCKTISLNILNTLVNQQLSIDFQFILRMRFSHEFLDLYLKSVFKKILFIKRLAFLKKHEKRNGMKFWTFVWTCYTWKKNVIWRMQYFSDTVQIQQYANSITSTLAQEMECRRNLSSCTKCGSSLLLTLLQ